MILNGENTYSGTTTVSAGKLDPGNLGGFGDGEIRVDGGTILFSQTTEADSSDSVVLLAEGGTFEVIEGVVMTFPGVLSGEGSATKTGLGKLILSGDNTYTGSSNVNAGELEVSGSLNDSSALNVNSSGRYVVSKNDTIGSISGGGGHS